VALFKTGIERPGAVGTYVYQLNYAVARDGQRFLINTATGPRTAVPTNIVLNWPAALGRR
jgi:hypothetical protein